MGEENNENVQNFPTNPGPSTLEIQPKTCNEVSPLEAQNSLVEYTQDATRTMIQDTGLQEMLENFYPVMDKENNDIQNSDHPGVSTTENQPEMYNEASTSKIQDSSMEYTSEDAGNVIKEMLEKFFPVMDKENDNIQNSLDNPGPSTMEIQPETNCNEVSNCKTQNSSMEYASAEVIDIPSDSDDDRDYYYSDTSDVNDISIIGTVKAVDNDTTAWNPPSHLTDEKSINVLNAAPAVASSSGQATFVGNKTRNGSKVEENNNDVTYMKTVFEVKESMSNPKPGCSKDSDDTLPKLKNNFPNLDELLKDARLIHALLPRFSHRLIYKTLCNNQFARNRIELTLWDLLPVQRPQPQLLQKRKSLDEICLDECSNASLEKNQVDTKTVVENEEQNVKCVITNFIRKLKNRPLASSTDEIDDTMKRNMPETTVLNTNNYINQPSAIPMKKTKLVGLNECFEHNNINASKTFASSGEIDGMKKNIPEVILNEAVLNEMNNDNDQSSAISVKRTKLVGLNECFEHDNTYKAFASSTGEIDGTKRNMLEIMNDTNNDIPQTSMKRTKLIGSNEYIENNNALILAHNNIPHNLSLRCTPQDLRKSVSSEDQKIEWSNSTKKLQSTKNSEVKKKPELIPNNIATLPIASTVLQPAKLTLETNIMQPLPLQKIDTVSKPILSPPKLQFIGSSSTQTPTNSMQMKQDGSITLNVPSYQNANNSSAVWLPSTSSNNKKASCDAPPSLPWLDLVISQFPNDPSKNMENTQFVNVCTSKKALNEPLYNRPSSSVETTQNILDRHHKEGITKLHLNQEADDIINLSTSQVHDGENKQQYLPFSGKQLRYTLNTRLIEEDVTEDDDYKEEVGYEEGKLNATKEKSKCIGKDAKKIVLNERANEIYTKLKPMFPSVKIRFIKQLCHDYVRDYEEYTDDILLESLINKLLKTGQENLKKIKPVPVVEEPNVSYNMNEQYADLLMIFPEADPVYLRKVVEDMQNDHERIKEFVQSKLENPDYPTRAQYLAKKKITEQQKQYTTDFKVQQFLEIFPNPFSYFEDDKRNCQFNPHAIDFLKYYFSKLRVNTLVNAYSRYQNNLSLTAMALEALNPDMKTKRYSNKMILTEDIPFLQECAFIQHKAELRKYLDEIKTKEEQEFNELKAKNELLECQCCFDNECMPSKCSTCEDGHVFCNLCIIRSTDVVLGDGNTRVDCLIKCGCEFPISVLQRVLPPTKFSILLCKRQEAEVIAAGVEGLVSCPFCHFASIPPPEDKIFKCLNPECMKESCRLCKELNHIPLKCNEKKSEHARLYLEERMTEALVRKCYRCNRIFFKEEGCNKMTCVCGAQMCYICDKPVTDYKHFQGQGAENSNLCPLWSDDRRLNAESVIKVCQETVKQIKEKDPQIDINVDALLPKLPPKSKGPHDNIQNAVIHNRLDARRFPFG